MTGFVLGIVAGVGGLIAAAWLYMTKGGKDFGF